MAVMINTVSPILWTRPQFLPFSYINQTAPLSLVAEITSTWSVALVKISIAIMLLRLQRTRNWALFLYTIIGIQFIIAAFVTIIQTTRCIPITALWDPTSAPETRRCWGEANFKASLTAASILIILTDVIFALIPLTFLHHVRRSLRDRLIIGFLMSLGLFASAAAVVKTIMVQRFNQADDPAGHGMSIALWASIEAQVGIIAACIPCLRAAFLRFLGRVGIRTAADPTGGNAQENKAKMSWRAAVSNNGPLRLYEAPPTGKAGREGCDPFDKNLPTSRITAVSTRAVTGRGESDEDVLVSNGNAGVGGRHGRIECKTQIDIELASIDSA